MTRLPHKWIRRPCPRCGGPERAINPAYLRATRRRAGLTLAHIAAQAHCSVSLVSAVELGHRRVTQGILAAYQAIWRLNNTWLRLGPESGTNGTPSSARLS